MGLHVPGILRLLSEHLYANPQAALRELIQNAHDSCQRRRVEDPSAGPDYEPRIDIHVDADRRALTLSDNGSGLTVSEIRDYLATIGRGYTSELQRRLAVGNSGEASIFVGQFGLGLLSAFIVADRVELLTRSYQPGETGWRWESAGGETYTLAPADRPEVGTTLTLHLRLEGEFLLNEALAREIVRRYADFLRVPITVNGAVANTLDAPWHRDAGLSAYRAYLAERFGAHNPLSVIPLHRHVERIRLPDGSQDEVITPLGGVLFVPPASMLSVGEYGDLHVYVRRMFVTDEERGLLPGWARFVRGVVDSPALSPTASREQVRRDEGFYAVQRALEVQLLDHFRRLARDEPEVWGGIVLAHNDLIKAWALESPALFDAVCNLVTFETSRGRLPLPEILAAGDGMIYLFTEGGGSTIEKMLYEARGLVVVDASRFAEEAFLEACVRANPGIELSYLEPGADVLFEPVDDTVRWEPLARYFADQGIPMRVVGFEPAEVPALLVHPPSAGRARDAQDALDSGAVRGAVAGLIRDYLAREGASSRSAGVLHLNARNGLLRRLRDVPPASGAFSAALEIVYQTARVLSGRALTPRDVQEALAMTAFSLDQLVRALAGSADADPWNPGPDV
jgi:molecular chaperone HtpG